MPSHLCLSIRLLAPEFHGRLDGGHPEWPPSPLRAFQSLVAAASARRYRDGDVERARAALTWLERQPPPTVVAPAATAGSGYRISVPNNAMDIVARAWVRGNTSNVGDANPATHRTMKMVRATSLRGGDTVHYVWSLVDPLEDDAPRSLDTLATIARSVMALGWGIDMAIGHSSTITGEQADALIGERWTPAATATGTGLRVPMRGTLDDLERRHAQFLDRLGSDGFCPPSPLTIYARVAYRRAIDPAALPVAGYSLLKMDASALRAFDTVRSGLRVAGMVRHTARLAAERAGWSETKVNAFVLGHGESLEGSTPAAVGPQRFTYLPLPSIESRSHGRTVGDVRRVLLSCFRGGYDEIGWARRALTGQELVDAASGQPVALLSLQPATDRVIQSYTRAATVWASVTPVILPGYDDPGHYRRRLKRGVQAEEQRALLERLADRIDGLLRKALRQAGFSGLLADHAELEWRKSGFWPGTDVADRYGVPDHLSRFPRVHVKIRWRDANHESVQIRGPVCVGGGRFFGIGLFAAL